MAQHQQSLGHVETLLGYQFENRELLLRALTTPTANISDADGQRFFYEELEHLGDRVINLLATQNIIYLGVIDDAEVGGANVSNQFLTQIAKALTLHKYVISGYDNPTDKQLADVIEAIFGAIYADSGRDMYQLETIWNALITRKSRFKQLENWSPTDTFRHFGWSRNHIANQVVITDLGDLGIMAKLHVPDYNLNYKETKPKKRQAINSVLDQLARDLKNLLLEGDGI